MVEPTLRSPVAIDSDPEFFHGLTMWANGLGVQVRDSYVAVHFADSYPRSKEIGEPAVVPVADARRLRDLLNLATARGFL